MIQENGLTPKSAILTKLASQKPFMPPHIALAYDHLYAPFAVYHLSRLNSRIVNAAQLRGRLD